MVYKSFWSYWDFCQYNTSFFLIKILVLPKSTRAIISFHLPSEISKKKSCPCQLKMLLWLKQEHNFVPDIILTRRGNVSHMYLHICLYIFNKMDSEQLSNFPWILSFLLKSYGMFLSINSHLKQTIYKALCLRNCVMISLFRHNSFCNCHCAFSFLCLL